MLMKAIVHFDLVKLSLCEQMGYSSLLPRRILMYALSADHSSWAEGLNSDTGYLVRIPVM